ncbi:antibiotic biosynthesis monooxygenase [Microvirga tunisiensis]|uniref:Antibiotic biosynthesis monooxygenase n=2 Tax=Pannonibacter tanglangensis TaxID=2750084 RepID=A0ABW9ZLQ7_9HYPH|nr:MULTISPECIES: antibiotic biosynthesis monooxygenase [unclassified Pannonibacter]NBN63660.1 antibiotic biosynthesis monooxygenase [Pannonibacter sp. XCT-34]NBN77307.1 antibiotic biosynthesis monooxygenase [Pannonibacter sp. XCT-53]
MFIAMNRFKVKAGKEAEFEAVWKGRDSRLSEMAGFRSFHLLQGPADAEAGITLYASHTVWESREHFLAWTKSEQFREAHRNAGGNKDLYAGPPQFEGFAAVEGA